MPAGKFGASSDRSPRCQHTGIIGLQCYGTISVYAYLLIGRFHSMRCPVPLPHIIVLAPLSLLMLIPSLVSTQASPSPSVEEFEMGPGDTPAAEGRVVDTAVLAQFKEEYGAAQEAPRPVFEKYLPRVGAAALLDVLEETYPACHAQAHDLGKALFAAHQDLGAALRACGTRCTSGCMHGAVAEAFGNSTLAVLTAQMNTFCDHGEMARLHKPGNCAHALGHALMFVTGGDVRQSCGCLPRLRARGTAVLLRHRGVHGEDSYRPTPDDTAALVALSVRRGDALSGRLLSL